MNLAILALLLAVACAAVMTVAWRVAVATGKTGWIDVIWTFGVGITGAAAAFVPVAGEGIADRQLARFAANPANKGKVCDVGLWSWSRHPNYFFEWLGWVAYPVIAIDLTGNYWWGLASLVAPAMMYWLLAHVSGVPPLEEHMLKSRGEAFRAYQRRVSAFFPAPPKTQEQT